MRIIDLKNETSYTEINKKFVDILNNDITTYGNVKKIVANGQLQMVLMFAEGYKELSEKPKLSNVPYLVGHYNDIEIYTNPLIIWGELEYTFYDDSDNRIESFKTESNGEIL